MIESLGQCDYWFNHKNGGMEAVNKNPKLKAERDAFVQQGRDVVARQTAEATARQEGLSELAKKKVYQETPPFYNKKSSQNQVVNAVNAVKVVEKKEENLVKKDVVPEKDAANFLK